MSFLNHKAPISPYAFPGIKMKELSVNERNVLRKTKRKPDHEIILNAVSEYFVIPVEWIKSKSRKRPIVWARQVYCYLCLNNTGMTLLNIGLTVGMIDHSSVYYSKQQVSDVADADSTAARQVRELQGIIKNLISNES